MLLVLAVLVIGFVSGNWWRNQTVVKPSGIFLTDSAAQLRDEMRTAWTEHVFWTRLFIVSAASQMDDLDAVTGRLLKNQEDIGKILKPYYGAEAADRIGKSLLREHILIAAEIVSAARLGKSEELASLDQRWRFNADEIAAYLSELNPAWDKKSLQDALYTHLEQTKDEAAAHLGGDYAADIAAFDRARDHILVLADVLTQGIIAQFPEEFTQ